MKIHAPRLALLFVSALSSACLSPPDAADEQVTGSATIALSEAPADAICLRISVQATKPLERLVALTPGQVTQVALEGLSLGPATFTGSAYDQPCSAVLASSIPRWVSDSVPTEVSPRVPVPVVLTLRRATGTAQVTVNFEGDLALTELLTLVDGSVIDFDGTRALGLSASETRATIETIYGEREVIYDSPAGPRLMRMSGTPGRLYPGGAVLMTSVTPSSVYPSPSRVWIWNGALSEVALNGAASVAVNGSWLAYARRVEVVPVPPGGPTTRYAEELVLHDLQAGVDTWVLTPPSNGDTGSFGELGVGPDGDLIWQYESGYPVGKMRRDGVITSLWSVVANSSLATDGVNDTFITTNLGTRSTTLINETGATETLCPTPPIWYACRPAVLRGGYVGFTRFDSATGFYQPFRRTLTGEYQQLSAGTRNAEALLVSDHGDVLVQTIDGATSTKHRTIFRADGTAQEIEPTGTVIYRDDWYVLRGASVYVVNPPG